jgi:hypothetical protein
MALLYDGPLMNTDERGYFDALTERVLGAVFEVSNNLSAGFLEKVYQRALIHELRLRGIRAAKVEWKRIVHGFQIPEPTEAPTSVG